jgi:hypothetical protein
MLKSPLHLFPSICLLLLCVSNTRPILSQTSAPNSAEPLKLEFVFEEVVTLGPGVHAGATPWGDRNIVPITGGSFAGPKIKGKVLSGGWDWQLTTQTGCFRVQADYMIQTDDGAIINVVNKGTSCKSGAGKEGRLLTTPAFEAPQGAYEWLNGGAYVGTLDVATIEGKPTVRIRFYKAL